MEAAVIVKKVKSFCANVFVLPLLLTLACAGFAGDGLDWFLWIISFLSLGAAIFGIHVTLRNQSGWIRWIAALVVCVGSLLRNRFVMVWHPPGAYIFSDMHGYWQVAQSWLAHVWEPAQSIKPAGYSLLLAALIWIFPSCADALAWTHHYFGVFCVIASWRATAAILGEQRAIYALALLSFHFPLVAVSGFYMPDVIFAAILAGTFYLLSTHSFPWSKWIGLLTGFLCSISMWFKGNNILYPGLLGAWVLWAGRDKGQTSLSLLGDTKFKKPLIFLAFLLAGALGPILAYGALNHFKFHVPGFSSTNGGLSLIEGKCPAKHNWDSEGATWKSPLFVQIDENEQKHWPRPFYDQAYFVSEGLRCIRENPTVMLSSFRYIYYLFYGNLSWPSNITAFRDLNREFEMFFTPFLLPGLLFALISLLLNPLQPLMSGGLMVASLFLNSWLLKSEFRYRVPFDVVIVPLIVAGWSSVGDRLFKTPRERRLARFLGVGFVLLLAMFVTMRLTGIATTLFAYLIPK